MSVLLAADTSGKNGSIALARITSPDALVVEILEVVPLAGGTFSAQLVPQISDLLCRHQFTKADIAAFAVVSGPGSFTGLRVGLAAIKALAEVLKKPIAAVSLLEVIATCSRKKGRVHSALEAGRGEVYVGEYIVQQVALPGEGSLAESAAKSTGSSASQSWTGYQGFINAARLVSERILSREEFVEVAKSAYVVTPDVTLAELVRSSGGQSQQIAYPDSGFITHLAWRKLREGHTVSPADLEANYIRRSDAEIFSKPR